MTWYLHCFLPFAHQWHQLHHLSRIAGQWQLLHWQCHEITWCWSAVWYCNDATNFWTIKIESLYMLWSQYKLETIRCSEFLRKEITGFPNISNRNSNFLTLQTYELKKKNGQNLRNRSRNRNSAYDGGPRNWNQNWNSQPRLLLPMLCIRGTTIKTGNEQAWHFANALCLSITNKDY